MWKIEKAGLIQGKEYIFMNNLRQEIVATFIKRKNGLNIVLFEGKEIKVLMKYKEV